MKKLSLLLILVLGFSLVLTGCFGGEDTANSDDTIVVSGKKFTEQVILADIITELLKAKTDLNIVNKGDLGAVDILTQGMKDGDIDIYTEYTGTAYMVIMKEELDTMDPQVIYDRVKKYYNDELNITWLDSLSFNNTYAIALSAEKAEELGVETISDLQAHVSDLELGCPVEFLEREDGAPNFNKAYNLEWKNMRGMDPGLMYTAVKEGQIDVITAFATDGRIPRYNLKILEDDKQFFPPYFAAPMVRNEVLEKHPEIADILNELAPHLTDEKMAELNSKVDIDGVSANQVAKDFLTEAGLI